MIACRKATLEDLEQIWDKNIADNPGDDRYLRWKRQFIADNTHNRAVTFVIVTAGAPVGEGTLLLSPDCRAIRGRTCLCDGKTTANINALRIDSQYEGQGHISRLMKEMECYAKQIGITRLTIGVEEEEMRNRQIYHHWDYRIPILEETEDGARVLYYGKDLK